MRRHPRGLATSALVMDGVGEGIDAYFTNRGSTARRVLYHRARGPKFGYQRVGPQNDE